VQHSFRSESKNRHIQQSTAIRIQSANTNKFDMLINMTEVFYSSCKIQMYCTTYNGKKYPAVNYNDSIKESAVGPFAWYRDDRTILRRNRI